jgi:NAD(P)-dependent dehydrogenase (short-subunit alcohol dehydrogenase family)
MLNQKGADMSDVKKVVLVTGASSGIGRAAAGLLAAKGFKVYACARRLEAMADLAGLGVTPLELDITDEHLCRAVVDEILYREGRIDALVNNAGYGANGALEDVPDEEARHQFDVNVFGLMYLTRLVLPHMRGQGSGRIVNISSIGGKLVMPMAGWYHASKFALEALSDALRLEVEPFGLDVVVIEPGGVLTEFADIAKENLLGISGAGPYAGQARLIAKALESPRPKTRYAAPCHAKVFLFLRWLLPDRLFDKMLRGQMRGLAKEKTKCRCSLKCCGQR